MKKIIRGFIVSSLMVVLFIGVVMAATDVIKIEVGINRINISLNGVIVGKANENYTLNNGEQVPNSILYKGTTYLPIRKIAEDLELDVTWNGLTNTAGLNNKDFVAEEEKIKVGMVTDSGMISDKSFNQGTWEGILQAKDDFGFEEKYLQPRGETTEGYLNEIKNLVDTGHEVIVTPGFKFENAIFIAQDLYPDTNFIIIDGQPHSADYSDFRMENNVVSVFFYEEEAGFLAGVAAALESNTGKLGFIGGMEIPPVQRYGWGFTAGIAYANENYGTNAKMVDYIYQGTFNDVLEGEKIAASMYEKGIDIIHTAAGGVGLGAISEAKRRATNGEEVFIVGVDIDQYYDGVIEDGSSIILTSAIKKIDTAAYTFIKAHLNGDFTGGETISLSAKENGIGLPPTNPNLSAATVSKVNDVFATLAEESLQVPHSLAGLLDYLKSVNYITPNNVEY